MKSHGMENRPSRNAGHRLESSGLLLCPCSIVSQSLILLFCRFADEARTYENIYAQRPAGFDFFPSLLSIGKICCSSIFPQGYIIVMTKVDGERLDKQWNQLSGSVKEHIRSEIYKAIKVLRQASTIVIDSGMHNVLYDPETNAVTMVDFELMQACEDDTMSPDEPEMFSIFGHYPSRVRVRHEGG